jgi:hypothetical protein
MIQAIHQIHFRFPPFAPEWTEEAIEYVWGITVVTRRAVSRQRV